MTRLIDADDLLSKLRQDPLFEFVEQYGISEVIENAPTTNAVPVIRCRYCKHYEPWYGDRGRCFLWNEDGIDVWNDGYCNYGEVKIYDRKAL